MSPPELSRARFIEEAAALVRRLTGLAFSDARRQALETGLAVALGRSGEHDPDRYLIRLADEPALLDDLIDRITIGETYFFRDPGQFDFLRDEIVPALLTDRGADGPLRIWSAGCATGEEAYSVAIALMEQGLGPGRILGTDISAAALAMARAGRYTRWSLRNMPDALVEKYFHRVDRRFELSRQVRQSVEFGRLNLARDAYPSAPAGLLGMDLILCRNVFIYFDGEIVAAVAERLLASLAEHGWLLLGAADPPLGHLVRCEVLVTPAGLAYRRPERRRGAARAPVDYPGIAEPPPTPVAIEPPVRPPPLPAEAVAPASRPSEPAAHDAAPKAIYAYLARDYELAAELARQAIADDPGDPTLWPVLVRALANQGRLTDAGEVCAAALDLHPTLAELVYLLSLVLAEDGRYREAVDAARRALYLDPMLVVAHVALGDASGRLGDHRGAELAFRNADRLLGALEPNAVVPASDGEPASRVADVVRMRLKLLARGA